MGLGKWIIGLIGFITSGPLGALAGYVIGHLLESNNQNERDYSHEPYRETDSMAGQRNGFLFSMLVLASYIIRADGKIMHSEMEFVRQFLRRNFGEQAVEEGQQILLNLFERAKQEDEDFPGSYRNTILDCCAQIRGVLSYEQRLQLLSFLTQISQSDGQVCQEEIKALKEVAQHLGLSEAEVNSMLNLRSDHLEDAYKVLEITPSATDAEVRTAYKKMALKHHPDRVATLGEDIRRNAEEKFQQINDAKERIYKARGLK